MASRSPTRRARGPPRSTCPAAPGLDDHRAHGVGDDVVQLTARCGRARRRRRRRPGPGRRPRSRWRAGVEARARRSMVARLQPLSHTRVSRVQWKTISEGLCSSVTVRSIEHEAARHHRPAHERLTTCPVPSDREGRHHDRDEAAPEQDGQCVGPRGGAAAPETTTAVVSTGAVRRATSGSVMRSTPIDPASFDPSPCTDAKGTHSSSRPMTASPTASARSSASRTESGGRTTTP